jgi:glutamine amidotransferase PdxT
MDRMKGEKEKMLAKIAAVKRNDVISFLHAIIAGGGENTVFIRI